MLNIRISLRFLIKKPFQAVFAALVVAIGVAIFYFVLNAGTSLKNLVFSSTADSNSHIIVVDTFEFDNYEDQHVIDFMDKIYERQPNITDISYSYTITASTPSKLGHESHFYSVKGMDFDYGGNIQRMNRRIGNVEFNNYPKDDFEGDYFGEMAVGQRFASRQGMHSRSAAIGKMIDVVYGGKTYKFKIVAYIVTDNDEIAERAVYTTIETVQRLTQLNLANGIEMLVENPLDSNTALLNIEDIIHEYYPTSSYLDWQLGNRFAVNALYIEEISILIIQVFTALAISFGVTALLAFMIRERVNQIGILKALGITDNDTKKIFISQIIFISIPSIFAGLFFGDFLARFFNRTFRRPGSKAALVSLQVGIFNDYSLISALVMFVTCMIAIIPAVRYVGNLKVIEVIKND